jgi:hypothetical protein
LGVIVVVALHAAAVLAEQVAVESRLGGVMDERVSRIVVLGDEVVFQIVPLEVHHGHG